MGQKQLWRDKNVVGRPLSKPSTILPGLHRMRMHLLILRQKSVHKHANAAFILL